MSNGYHIVFLQHVFVFDFLIKNDLVYCFVHWFCVVFEMVLSVLPSKTYIFFLKHMRFDMLFQFFNVDGSISSISIASHFTGPRYPGRWPPSLDGWTTSPPDWCVATGARSGSPTWTTRGPNPPEMAVVPLEMGDILVGGFNHLEKYEFVNGKDDIPYMKWENNQNVPNHQPALVNKAFDIGLYMDNQPGMMILPVWGRYSQ